MTIKSMTGLPAPKASRRPRLASGRCAASTAAGSTCACGCRRAIEALEPHIREAVARQLTRGSLTVSLNVQRQQGADEIRLNEPALRQVLKAADRSRRLTDRARRRAEGLLAIKGVLEVVESRRREADGRRESMIVSLDKRSTALVRARAERKARGSPRCSRRSSMRSRAGRRRRGLARARPEAIRRRLKEQIASCWRPVRASTSAAASGGGAAATRADVEEELKRLHGAHRRRARAARRAGERSAASSISWPRSSTARPTPCAPRRTTCEITRAGLELKAVIDQMREQVQNIE